MSIVNILELSTSLTNFSFTGNIIDSKDISNVINSLNASTSVTTLTIEYYKHNKKHDNLAKDISQLLIDNISLTTLLFDYNEIDDNGAKLIAGALNKNTKLLELSIRHNCISPDGIKYFFEMLKINKSLTALHYHNQNHTQNDLLLADKEIETNIENILKANKEARDSTILHEAGNSNYMPTDFIPVAGQVTVSDDY